MPQASFNISIYACDEASCWPCALLLFDLLKSSYLLPSIVTYNSTIHAWARDSWQGESLRDVHVERL
jgi:hypothetical protein